jgi:hypothetical protein
MDPEFIGIAKDAKNETSPDLSLKSVEEPGVENQTIEETQNVGRQWKC